MGSFILGIIFFLCLGWLVKLIIDVVEAIKSHDQWLREWKKKASAYIDFKW